MSTKFFIIFNLLLFIFGFIRCFLFIPDKLLVVSYAWDGNALPGNEWWLGQLDSSGDPAAASSTQVAELHNPHINPILSADNLMVVTDNDVVTIEKYQDMVRLGVQLEQQ